MNRVVLCLVLVGALALAAPMSAVICTIDAVPAATLLLPYFEVDLNNPNGLTTLFSVNNASATAPDLPSNGSSGGDVSHPHSNGPTYERPDLVRSCHYLPGSGVGNLRACSLPWMW